MIWRPLSRFGLPRLGAVIQATPNNFQQGASGAGLRKETSAQAGNKIGLAPARFWTVATDENDLDLGVFPMQPLGQFAARETARHHEIGHQQVHFGSMGAPDFEGLLGRLRFPDAVTSA